MNTHTGGRCLRLLGSGSEAKPHPHTSRWARPSLLTLPLWELSPGGQAAAVYTSSLNNKFKKLKAEIKQNPTVLELTQFPYVDVQKTVV